MEKDALVGRDYYLDLLDRNTDSFKKGNAKSIAFLGQRKSGKTLIVKEHIKNAKDIIPIYIDAEKISLNPENFSIEFIGNILFHFLKRPLKEYKNLLLLENLLKIEEEIGKNAFSIIKIIDNELLKIKPDQKLLVETAFRFSEILGKDSKSKFLIILDNFENLLDLNNFSQIKDVISLINFDSSYVNYIVTSSSIKQSLHLLKRLDCYEIKNLEKKDAVALTERYIGKNEKASDEIFALSKGHPFVTVVISKKYKEIKDVKKVFLIELLKTDNSIYSYCRDSYNYHYNRARGQTLLRTILKVVANEELRLSEIARRIYRSAPVTKSIIERLMEVDIIYKKDNKFYFADNVLRLWLKLTSHGYEFDEIPDDKILEEAAKEI